MNSGKILRHSGIRTTYPNAMSEPLCKKPLPFLFLLLYKTLVLGTGRGCGETKPRGETIRNINKQSEGKRKRQYSFKKLKFPRYAFEQNQRG